MLPAANAIYSPPPPPPPTDPFTLTVNGSPTDPGTLTFNAATNMWSSDPIGGFNSTPLPAGSFFDSSNSLDIDLQLSNPITLGDNINFGFGLAGLDPVPPGGFLFGFSISLLDDGSPITLPFGFELSNPFDFDVTNVATGTSTGITGGTFDQIDITVTGEPLQLDPQPTSFSVGLGNHSVPDGGATVAMLGAGLTGLALLRRRFAK